ncbi:MAG: TetR/AcrR family transcriptional regulator [Lachnospiraceae bacterium]|nr:TetR/AcrR family transcriptional regulator [Lachnospiraceae bacterium]
MAQDKEATKDCIFTALIMLMEQKEYKYISVTDIARKAGVSRMTYYRTYSSKEDILVQHFDKIAHAMIDSANGSARLALVSFFSYFCEHEKLTELLEGADLMNLLKECFAVFTDYLYKTMHPKARESAVSAYAAQFEAGGVFSVLIGWLKGGAVESPEEMANITLKILGR